MCNENILKILLLVLVLILFFRHFGCSKNKCNKDNFSARYYNAEKIEDYIGEIRRNNNATLKEKKELLVWIINKIDFWSIKGRIGVKSIPHKNRMKRDLIRKVNGDNENSINNLLKDLDSIKRKKADANLFARILVMKTIKDRGYTKDYKAAIINTIKQHYN